MGHAFQSDLRRWDIVAGLCQACDARTYVEVGCKDGRTTGFVLAQCPQLRAIAIDPWCEQPAGHDASRETYADWDFPKIQAEFWKNIGEHRDRVEMLREPGHACSDCYEVNGHLLDTLHGPGFDVVFIDALHDHESVFRDIADWWPLVNVGGYLAGHDYNHKWPGVMRAVADKFNLMDVCLGPDSMWWIQKKEPCCPSAFGAQV